MPKVSVNEDKKVEEILLQCWLKTIARELTQGQVKSP